MRKNQQPDYILFIVISLLVLFGLMMIFSAGMVVSYEKVGNPYYFFKKQIFNLLIGLFLGYIAYKIPVKTWKILALPLFLVSLVLLAMIFIPGLGFGHNASQRWLQLGEFTFQPSEIMKISFILYLAGWLDKKGKEIRNFSNGFIPFIIIVLLPVGLIMSQPDIGTGGVIILTAIAIYFLAGAKLSHIGLLILGGLSAFLFLVKTAAYRLDRLKVFLHPEIDPQGIGYQINQAALAFGSGGIFGLGLGQSMQKYNYLPEPITDSITAIIGEELGFVGLIFLILLFLALGWRGLIICKNAPDKFSQLLAGGFTILILIQTFIHIGAISRLIPLTGLPLPFISYGGSSLINLLIAMGILLNISKQPKL